MNEGTHPSHLCLLFKKIECYTKILKPLMSVKAYWPLRRRLCSECLGVQTARGNNRSFPLVQRGLFKHTGTGLLRHCAQDLKQLQKVKWWSQGHLTRLELMPTVGVIANEMNGSLCCRSAEARGRWGRASQLGTVGTILTAHSTFSVPGKCLNLLHM